MSSPWLSPPNLLTLSRLPLAGALWIAPGDLRLLVAIMALAALTDVLDGWAARLVRRRRLAKGLSTLGLGEAGGLGAWLDPLCDKLFVVSLLAAVIVSRQPPWPVVLLVGTREILLVPLMLGYGLWAKGRPHRPLDLRAGKLGKLTTVLQFSTVAAMLAFSPAVFPLALAAALVGVAATALYSQRALRTLRGDASPTVGAPVGSPQVR